MFDVDEEKGCVEARERRVTLSSGRFGPVEQS